MYKIKVITGKNLIGTVFDIGEAPMLIGRSPECQIKIAETSASRIHAELALKDGRLFIQDLESANGTYVNGYMVKQKQLVHGDKIGIQNVVFQVEEIVEEAAKESGGLNLSDFAPDLGLEGAANLPGVEGSAANLQASGSNNSSGKRKKKGPVLDKDASPVEKIIFLLNYKVLLPYFEVCKKFSIPMVFLGLFCGFALFTAYYSIIPLSIKNHESIEIEVERRAIFSASLVAKANELGIRQQKKELIDSEYFSKLIDIKNPRVMSTSGKIWAPINMFGEYETDPVILKAAALKEGSLSNVLKNYKSGLWLVTYPIKVMSDVKKIWETKAVAMIEFEYRNHDYSFSTELGVVLVSTVVLGFVAIIIYFLVWRTIARPLAEVDMDLKLAMIGKIENIGTRFQIGELQTLTQTINFALIKAREAMSEKLAQKEKQTYTQIWTGKLAENSTFPVCAFKVQQFKILYCNQAFAQLVGKTVADLQEQELEQVVVDPDIIGLILQAHQDFKAQKRLDPVVWKNKKIGGGDYNAMMMVAEADLTYVWMATPVPSDD